MRAKMSKLCESFQAFVDDLKQLRVGVMGQPLIVDEFRSGTLKQIEEFDRFRLSFKIADFLISWEVIFDRNRPLFPPDVIFGPNDDEFSLSLQELKGYYDWDPASKSSLSDMLQSVIKEYSKFRRNSIATFPGINDEWNSLCEVTNYGSTCEVCCATNGPGTYNATVSFMFELTLDISELPLYLIKANVGGGKAILHITFQAPNLTKVTPRLYLSPIIEHAIGGSAVLRLPPYGSSDLKSYIEKVEILLLNTVKNVSERFTKRKELIATFLAEFHGSVIEYDAEGFNEISFLLNHAGIFVVLYVILGEKFPATPPTLVVQSTYHMAAKGPFRQTYKDYRYSPRWESKMIVESIREYLESVILDFKQDSFQNGKMA